MMALACLLLAQPVAWGNAQFNKAVQHFKDFEIKQAVGILTKLEADSSLSKPMQAKVALYLGMSYAYLRNKNKALEKMGRALQIDPMSPCRQAHPNDSKTCLPMPKPKPEAV